jgi:hypothetical protein
MEALKHNMFQSFHVEVQVEQMEMYTEICRLLCFRKNV